MARWRKASHQNELAVYGNHLDDLAGLANHPTRLQIDPEGKFFRIQQAPKKVTGTPGVADGWYKGHFLIEYKRLKGALDEAYISSCSNMATRSITRLC